MRPKPEVYQLPPGTHYLCVCGKSKNKPHCDGTHQEMYEVCFCGRSANQPFCDGSHPGSEKAPYVLELKEPKTVSVCTCKHSADWPFCDNSHQEA